MLEDMERPCADEGEVGDDMASSHADPNENESPQTKQQYQRTWQSCMFILRRSIYE